MIYVPTNFEGWDLILFFLNEFYSLKNSQYYPFMLQLSMQALVSRNKLQLNFVV